MSSVILTPPLITPGATLGIVNVGAPEPVDFKDRFEFGLGRLRDVGFEVKLADHVRHRDGYRSAPPENIAAEFNALWADPEVKGLLCAGGGITANALLPYLDFELFRRHPKVLVGASNPTVLLNAITHTSSIVTYHGPSVIWDFGDPDQPEATRDSFLAVLVDGVQQIASVPRFLRPGSATGPMMGGNLTSLLQLAGTKWMPDLNSTILVWEDIEEDAAHLASKLIQLVQLGLMDGLSGMIVGELVDCVPSGGVTAEQMVLDVLEGTSFPIGWGLPFGHTPLKAVLPLGIATELTADGSLTITQAD